MCFIKVHGDEMIKKLALILTLSSALVLADDLPEPGLAYPAYNPPAYIPPPVYEQATSAPPKYTQPPVYVKETYAPAPVIVTTQPVYLRQIVTYPSQPILVYNSKYPMVTNQLGYNNYIRTWRR